MPIFVPTHTAPADNPYERVHFVTEGITACVEQAKAAAGGRSVRLTIGPEDVFAVGPGPGGVTR